MPDLRPTDQRYETATLPDTVRVTLTLTAGGSIGLVDESGAGKATLLRLLVGCDRLLLAHEIIVERPR